MCKRSKIELYFIVFTDTNVAMAAKGPVTEAIDAMTVSMRMMDLIATIDAGMIDGLYHGFYVC